MASKYAAFAARVKQARQRAGLTQAEAAKLSGVSLRTFSRIEHGQTPPKAQQLVRLARGLGTTVQYLGGDEGAPIVRELQIVPDDHPNADVLRYFLAAPAHQDVTLAEQRHLIDYTSDRLMTYTAYAFLLSSYREQITEEEERELARRAVVDAITKR